MKRRGGCSPFAGVIRNRFKVGRNVGQGEREECIRQGRKRGSFRKASTFRGTEEKASGQQQETIEILFSKLPMI